MYAKSIRPRAKRGVQKERSVKRDDQIACPKRKKRQEMTKSYFKIIFVEMFFKKKRYF